MCQNDWKKEPTLAAVSTAPARNSELLGAGACLTVVPWCQREKGSAGKRPGARCAGKMRIKVLKRALWVKGGAEREIRTEQIGESRRCVFYSRIAGEGMSPGLGVRGMPSRWTRFDMLEHQCTVSPCLAV